ncbi:MAG TPA: DNA translocase FtsK 4TM domain-containing protein [Chitinophagales bacterium]|nr:DNA translocase FtsK 4TM domain-containing protein [Chitinophagales bacterium]
MLNLVADFTEMEEIELKPKRKKESAEAEPVAEKQVKPAKEKEKKPGKKPKVEEELTQHWWNDGRLTSMAGLLLLVFSFVLCVAFTSYLFTLADDQSEVLNGGLSALADSSIHARNALGRLGAWLANEFINNLFGLSSYLFAFMCFATGFNLLVRKGVFPVVKVMIYSLLGMVWLSSALAFCNSLIMPDSVLSWGGAFGNYLTGSEGYLTGLLKPFGIIALLITTALVFAVAVYNINFSFILNLFERKPREGVFTEAETGSRKDVPAFKDASENIFAKDNIQELTPELSEPSILEEESEEMPEEEITLIIPEKGKRNGKKETEEPELELEVEKTVEEAVVNENTGGLDTSYDPTLDLSNYKFPGLELLEEYGSDKVKIDAEELERNKNQIISTLNNYQIEISKIKATIGPTVTLYEIVPAPGVRISKIKNLEDDIALSLAALGIRIIAPIPGKGTIGIEVPNAHKEIVSMRSLLASEKFQNSNADLPICLGKSISNEIYVADLAKMPHLLMAGATGQGKSVGINSILASLLYKKHPSQLKFILVDPKKVELSLYEALENHFLAKLPGEEDAIITDTKKVVTTLNALCVEMDQRYDLLKKAQCRNLKEYNHKFVNRQLNPQNGHKFLPYIVLVIDEFADLIMTAGKEVEMPIARLAQLARAIGIHLILATQRPSVNIITGTIKANFPARIAFKTTSKIDSRTILDAGGAEQLIGRGDMLLSVGSDMIRLQCGFVDTPEVERVRDFISNQQGYAIPFLLPEYIDPNDKNAGGEDFLGDGERDDLFEDAARVIVQNQMGSTSLIQRRLKLGYNRAGRLMDQLQEAGIVGDNLGTKAREVKFKTEAELEQYLQKLNQQAL